jgi:DNA-binding beta-propeller fold protein YncE
MENEMAAPNLEARDAAGRPRAHAPGHGRAAGAFLLAGLLTWIGAPTSTPRAAEAPVLDSALVLRLAHGGIEFDGPQGIALDVAHGEVAVANTGAGRVEFFDLRTFPRGFFVHRVPDPATGAWRDGMPVHLAVDREGHVLISDLLADYVDVVNYRGRPVTRLHLPPPDDTLAAGRGPGALAIGPDGTIWVASRGKEGRIHAFDADYRLVRSWGTPGAAPGQLSAIAALAVTPQGEVVVGCVRTEVAIQTFDAQGTYLRGFGTHDMGPGNFSFPSGIAATADGRLWVSDAIRHTMQVFDRAGTLLGGVGGIGVGPGEYVNPSALASDGKGLLALAENAGRRFQLMWVR